jgi:hypothetical protein
MDPHHRLTCSKVSPIVIEFEFLLMIVLKCFLHLCDVVVVKVLLYISTFHYYHRGAQLHHGLFCDIPYRNAQNNPRERRYPFKSRKHGDAAAVL